MGAWLAWVQGIAGPVFGWLLFIVHLLVIARAITRPNRIPASRVAWVAVIAMLPLAGVIAYLLLGETSIGNGRYARMREVEKRLSVPGTNATPAADIAPRAAMLFDLCHTIGGLRPVDGNRIVLLGDPEAPADAPMRNSEAAIATLIADIEQARESVHIAFYIWLDDDIGQRVADAVCAAARRGVQCRVMVDALGSRALLGSPLWRQLGDAGVRQLATLDDISRFKHMIFSRVDLRDHRKIVVIDNRIGYCGSQNCASPHFRVKPKFAPWIDILLRFEGPLVRQQQFLFLAGWIPETGETGLDALPTATPLPERIGSGGMAQLFDTGPVPPHNGMSDMFVAAMYAAHRELLITSPYFVPDEALMRALCAAPRRGVNTTIVFPARNDSWLVGNCCRSAWPDLLAAGVKVMEYPLGLLHTKSMTIDGEIALVGSANMDRRSLELNFENNLLIADAATVQAIRGRQLGYRSVSRRVLQDEVEAWPFAVRLIQNAVGMMSPVL